MARSAVERANTIGSYTVLRRLRGAPLAPGRVYTAYNPSTGLPALVVTTPAAEWTPSGSWDLHVEAGTHPRPFVAMEVRRTPAACGHPAQELAQLVDVAAAALESVEGLPEVQQHLESLPSPWRRLWHTHTRARTSYFGALAGAVAAGVVALLATATTRAPAQFAVPQETALAGVAEQALVAPEAMAVAVVDARVHTLALDMPRTPFKGQYRPDESGKCDTETEVSINDGCWVAVKWTPDVCKRRGYEWKGGCYLPSIPTPKEPSSTAPRTTPSPAQRAR